MTVMASNGSVINCVSCLSKTALSRAWILVIPPPPPWKHKLKTMPNPEVYTVIIIPLYLLILQNTAEMERKWSGNGLEIPCTLLLPCRDLTHILMSRSSRGMGNGESIGGASHMYNLTQYVISSQTVIEYSLAFFK